MERYHGVQLFKVKFIIYFKNNIRA